MSKVKVHNSQSIWNLAMQHYGDVRGIEQLIADGVITGLNDVIAAGAEITISTPIKRSVKEYYEDEISAGRMIAVTTALDPDINSPGSPWTSGFSSGFGSGSAYTIGFSSGFY